MPVLLPTLIYMNLFINRSKAIWKGHGALPPNFFHIVLTSMKSGKVTLKRISKLPEPPPTIFTRYSVNYSRIVILLQSRTNQKWWISIYVIIMKLYYSLTHQSYNWQFIFLYKGSLLIQKNSIKQSFSNQCYDIVKEYLNSCSQTI